MLINILKVNAAARHNPILLGYLRLRRRLCKNTTQDRFRALRRDLLEGELPYCKISY
jgi:hypothetical protein